MDKDIAEFLAETVIEQFKDMPLAVERMSFDKSKLAEILQNTAVEIQSQRMQFPIKRDKAKNTLVYPTEGIEVQSLYPERIITTYDTKYHPLKPVRAVQKLKEDRYHNGVTPFDPEVICREMREDPEIVTIRRRILKEGHKYGVMAKFSAALAISEEHHGGDISVTLPLFFIPGSTKEDYDVLARFSLKHQRPSQNEIPYVTHGIFESRLFQE